MERRWLIVVYAATIFLSALLLFQVQPIISRYILPWFGGTPAVWTTAMLFFQTLLFVGYAYAHLSANYLKPRWQAGVHILLLVAAALSLPFVPSASWKPVDGSHPAAQILLLLSVCVGLPYFMLSATGPLVQAWFSRANPGRSPYRLYSLSNVGSLLALLTYPFLIEPALTLGWQATIWKWAFWLFAAFCGMGAVCMAAAHDPTQSLPVGENVRQKSLGRRRGGKGAIASQPRAPGWGPRLLWLLLPALASLAFLATTSFSCQDAPVVPFLWVAPLSLYLLSFVICFDHERWYQPRTTAAALLVISAGSLAYLGQLSKHPSSDRLALDVGLSFAGLFCLCMLCHGELVRLKPDPRYLTSFYLMIAAGGAVGGLFVGLVAPLIFSGYDEWYLAIWGGVVLTLAVLIGSGESEAFRRHLSSFLPATMIFAAALVVVTKLAVSRIDPDLKVIDMRRNFYGVLTVKEYVPAGDDTARVLYNGHITHGLQFVDADRRTIPTTYYSRTSGVGRAIDFFQSQTPNGLRIGAIGLGTGTLAAYVRPADQCVFYEINPEVLKISEEYFTFLSDARGRIAKRGGSLDVVMGDARLSLERDLAGPTPPRKFDLLAVDAFTGDGIPTHLLTQQAGDVYRRHLADGGVLAIHISNPHVELSPVVRGLAEYLGLTAIEIDSAGDDKNGLFSSDWMLLTKNKKLIDAVASVARKTADTRPPLLWTDDYSGLFRILKW